MGSLYGVPAAAVVSNVAEIPATAEFLPVSVAYAAVAGRAVTGVSDVVVPTVTGVSDAVDVDFTGVSAAVSNPLQCCRWLPILQASLLLVYLLLKTFLLSVTITMLFDGVATHR